MDTLPPPPSSESSYHTGANIIKDYVSRLTDSAGVYRMIGADNKVLYVGKAKNLKARVISYTRPFGMNNRIMRMVSQTQKMEFVLTKTESEALLLEADLIKSLKPHFNILLRDDKTYPYIAFGTGHDYAQIYKYRGRKIQGVDYYGPFASSHAVEQTLDILQKAFLLRTCNDYVFSTRKRPCLLYQIKRCSAPCTNEISLMDYKDSVKLAQKFLSGGTKSIVKDLTDTMYIASENMEFEKAALYRDRLNALQKTTIKDGFYPTTFSDADIVAIIQEFDMFCVQIMFFRSGQNWGTASYFPRANSECSISEVLDGFLGQFYQNKPCPSLIFISDDIPDSDTLSKALYMRYDVKVKIEKPHHSDAVKIMDIARNNASAALARKKSDKGVQSDLLKKLADILNIDTPLNRIEVYDNAHISGTNPVGAMIVVTPEGFDKKHYRTWKIKDKTMSAGDDYAMMREVLGRRFERILQDKSTNPETVPDLIILDGGQGQLSAVMTVATEYNITIPIIAVAKGEDRNAGRERFFTLSKPSFLLEHNDPVLYFVQSIRDEAHRFANGTHAKKRKMDMEKTSLDDITGIGTARKKALIAKFGSAKAVSSATLEEILQTPTISKQIAEKIFNTFNK